MRPDPFFSIIIPTYRAQDYLRRCLDSCVLQSFQEIEIIVIDDCGGDDSIKIAEEFASKDKRIRIISNPCNLGAFHSRWVGMKEARGEYGLFLDSDDFLALNACEVIFNALLGEKIDILVFGIEGCVWDPVITQLPSSKEESLQKLYHASICARVYSKEIFQKALQALKEYFPPIPRLNLHEDALISYVFLYFCKTHKIILDVLYFYCENPESLSRKKDKEGEFYIQRMHMIERIRVKRLFGYFDLFPFKDAYFDRFRKDAILNLEHILKLYRGRRIVALFSKRKGFFAYPKGIYLCNKLMPSWKNYIKIALYLLSFGKIRRI